MKRPSIVELITDPTKNFLTFFLIGTLLFTIVADGISALFWDVLGEWLQTRMGIENPSLLKALIVLSLTTLLLIVIYATNFSRWLKKKLARFPIFGIKIPDQTNVTPLTTTLPGLIAAMSPKDNSPAELAIHHHWNGGKSPSLKHCWLICTKKSLPYAQEMIKKFTDKGLTQTIEFHYGNYQLTDPEYPEQKLNLLIEDNLVDDPNYIRRLVNCIYADAQKRGLEESDVIADYTGATKGMTAGIILACTAPDRRLQYISQVDNSQLMEVKISYKLRNVVG